MGVYLYRINYDYTYKSSIVGREFENEWMTLSKDGTLTIKGSHQTGYCWDGCSPKLKFFDVCLGTPEAVLNPKTGFSKTYHASLVHDIFYQFSINLKSIIKRKEVDREFYNILKSNNFRAAKLYYSAVRAFGWCSWHRRK
ncbi:MAG: hypothetical protein WC214_04105 [Candidatus Omnitrophota bacterium]